MKGTVLVVTVIVMAASTWAITGIMRAYAIRTRLIDIPNERSSHLIATPRGGGLGFVCSSVLAFIAFACNGWMDPAAAMSLAGGGLLVALIGYIDDRRSLAFQWRLLAHFIAAGYILYCMSGIPDILFAGALVSLGSSGYVIGIIFLVWMLNLTNFMDGIDGLAAVEATSVLSGGVLLYWITSVDADNWVGPLLLGSSILGFLVWNWPPAKIFMGDAGSGFLGLLMGAFTLDAGRTLPALFWSWLILLGVFVVDATVTITVRVWSGAKFYCPHRTHAYQHAARTLGKHQTVTLIVAAINVIWLLPIAISVGREWIDGFTGLVIAYAPLLFLAMHLKAGR